MRALAGPVVVLAGAVLIGASVLTQELTPAIGRQYAGAPSGLAGLGGLALLGFGPVQIVIDLAAGRDAPTLPEAAS